MENIKTTLLSNGKKRVLFVGIAFLLSYIISYILDPYASFWMDYFNRPSLVILREWLVTIVFGLMISEASIFIHTRLNKQLPWTEEPLRRFGIETILNLISVLLIILFHILCYHLFSGEPFPGKKLTTEETRDFMQWITVSIIIAFAIISVNTGSYLILNWRNSAIEAAEHKLRASEHERAATEAELQALKLQIDPHFVFNNLSVLSELILKNQQLGYEYAENFSKVYRYLLVNSKKDIIHLADELKFLHAYIFLIKHRVGEGICFEINVNRNNQFLHLPPLTLQLLVENALKHNKTVKNNPLIIKVYDNEDKELIVENTLIAIGQQANSSGIGIQNIVRRYSLLSDRLPEIIRNDATFKVIVPLIREV